MTPQDLMSIHGVAWYGNCWKLVDDGIGYTLYRNNEVWLKYAYRVNVFRDMFKDIFGEQNNVSTRKA